MAPRRLSASPGSARPRDLRAATVGLRRSCHGLAAASIEGGSEVEAAHLAPDQDFSYPALVAQGIEQRFPNLLRAPR